MLTRESYAVLNDVELAKTNDEKLTKIQERKNRLSKIQKIQQEGSAATSSAWYLNVWSYCVAPMTLAVESLKSVLSFLSPVAVGLSWLHTAHSFERLYRNKNRTYSDYGNAFFSLAASGISTAVLILGAAVMSPALPFIAIGVFASFAAYGVFNFAKNIYRAIKTNDKEERKEYLKQAGKQLIGIVVNSLAIAVTVIFGIKLKDAVDKLTYAIDKAKESFSQFDFAKASEWGRAASALGDACLDYAAQGGKVLVALTSAVAAGLVVETINMNKQTLNYLRHPTKIWYELKDNPLAAMKMLVMAPIRLAALVVTGPIQGVVYGLTKMVTGLKNLFSSQPKPIEQTSKKIMSSQLQGEAKLEGDKQQKAMQVVQKIKAKINTLDESYPSIEHAPEKIQAKRFQLGKLLQLLSAQTGERVIRQEKKYHSVEEIEKDALKISPNVYGSFFRKVGAVKEITEEVRDLTRGCAPAA